MERRQVSSRGNPAIRRTASFLAAKSVTPNSISFASWLFTLMVPVGLFVIQGKLGAWAALIGIQLRLLCNVIDGLVAVEGGKRSAVGELYNEVPDRVSDTIVLVAIGYATPWPTLGWACALLAALTAYIRTFGGALGFPQEFLGPMAKQHRMAVCTLALCFAGLPMRIRSSDMFTIALEIIAIGSFITCVVRLRAITVKLKTRGLT